MEIPLLLQKSVLDDSRSNKRDEKRYKRTLGFCIQWGSVLSTLYAAIINNQNIRREGSL